MNGNYPRYKHLINAAATGLLHQIPVVGPMIQAVLAQMQREDLIAELRRLSRLLEAGVSLNNAGVTAEQLGDDLILLDKQDPHLASFLLMAEAEAGKHLVGEDAPDNSKLKHRRAGQNLPHGRFVYLAADNYADAAKTASIAADLGFLWRSYHAVGGARIPHVGEIHVGDLIALAYRLPNEFRLLLPLVVVDSGDHTVPINDAQDAQCRISNHAPHAPFVLADTWLTKILVRQEYDPDPVFDQQSGLNVKVLPKQVVHGMFPSPGQNAIWPSLGVSEKTGAYYLPTDVRIWIGQL